MRRRKSIKTNYQPASGYSTDKVARPRHTATTSRLPNWIAGIPLVQRFNRLTRRRKIILIAWTVGSIFFLSALFTTIYYANTLSSKERIMNRNKTGVTLLDSSGKEFYSFYNANSNTTVPLNKISESAREAVVASEDKNFYHHSGFSPVGIANALWQNIKPSGLDNGGSTITQQLVKTALLSEQRSYVRKYQELILSIEIERRYSKDEILEMYLNSVYFGEGAFGIEDAAQTYFSKPASQLDLAQSSMLIGLLPAPSAYSPVSGDVKKAEKRQNYVLERMREDDMITAAEEKQANDEKLTYQKNHEVEDFKAPHFALMVKDELINKYGEEQIARSGYRVTTTLNLDLQSKAEQAVANQVSQLQYSNVDNGAAVVLEPSSGGILALVGSKDWNDPTVGKLNIATNQNRQPGSSFKPIMYASGIENETFSAATLLDDKPTDFGGYQPKNYDLSYRGKVTVRRSLANSLNVTAVQAQQMVGVDKTVELAQNLGISSISEDKDYGLSLALGSAQASLLDMTNAYNTFANVGSYNKPTTVKNIIDKDKKQIFEHEAENKQVLSSESSYIMSSMMSDQIARSESFGSSLNLYSGKTAAVKTGTTENYRDAWTIGYTPQVSVGAWVGNNDNSPMNSVAGSLGAAPIWREIMDYALTDVHKVEFEQPSGIVTRTICRGNGALADTNNGSGVMTEYFIPGTLPTTSCNAPAPEPEPEQNSDNQDQSQSTDDATQDTTNQDQTSTTDPDANTTDPNTDGTTDPTTGGGTTPTTP